MKKVNRNVSIVHVCIVYVCRIYKDFLCSPEGGGGLALYCMYMYAYGAILIIYSRDLDTPDQYQNIPLYLWLIQCTLSHNSWTDRQYFKQGTKNMDNQLFADFGINFATTTTTKIQQGSFLKMECCPENSGVHSFSICKTMFLVMSCIYFIPMYKSNKVHVNEDTAEECKYYTWITNWNQHHWMGIISYV